ncbi:MAG: nucleoside recognition domain-containing protein [Acetivibrionales bacterium]
MLNYIWAVMLLSGFAIGVLNGRVEAVTNAAFSSAGKAVELCIGLLGIICLWSGLMKIMEKSGLVDIIAKLARPVLKLLFPQIKDNCKALGAVVLNLAANFMGLGNAATPLGIKAMIELQKANGGNDTASDAMCMFLVLNTSAIQLIPSTIIALRNEAGSAAPAEITACIWFASACATLTGVFMARLMSGMNKTRGRAYAGQRRCRAA